MLALVNLSIVVSEQQKIQVAVTQAAQYIIGQRYWLGAVRTDYDSPGSHKFCQEFPDTKLQVSLVAQAIRIAQRFQEFQKPQTNY